jgi:hypothetical protein
MRASLVIPIIGTMLIALSAGPLSAQRLQTDTGADTRAGTSGTNVRSGARATVTTDIRAQQGV